MGVCSGGTEGGCSWTEHSPAPNSDMITCASFLAPPHMSLTTFFYWGRMGGSRSMRVYKQRGEEAENSEVCWDLKTFSSTATKGAGTIIHKKTNEHSFSHETPLTWWGGMLALWAGWGSMGLCSSDSQVSAGNKLNWSLCEADCAEHLLERQESHEMTITFPGKGPIHQATGFLEGDTPMPANRAVLFYKV